MSIWSPGHTVVLVCAGLELFQKGREEKGEQEAVGSLPVGESKVSLGRTPSREEGDSSSERESKEGAAVVGSFHGRKLAEAGKLVGEEVSLLPPVGKESPHPTSAASSISSFVWGWIAIGSGQGGALASPVVKAGI